MNALRARVAAGLARLRAWASTSNVAAQGGRFLRLTLTAFAATGIIASTVQSGSLPTRGVLAGAIVGAVEVAYRQMVKVSPKKALTDAVTSLVSTGSLDVSTILVDPVTTDPAPAPTPALAVPVPPPGVVLS